MMKRVRQQERSIQKIVVDYAKLSKKKVFKRVLGGHETSDSWLVKKLYLVSMVLD